jgi:hypothetical protein
VKEGAFSSLIKGRKKKVLERKKREKDGNTKRRLS